MRMLDSNIIVYAYNRDAPERKYCLPIIKKAILGELDTSLSVISLVEVYHILTERVPKPLSKSEALGIVRNLALSGNIQKVGITEDRLIEAVAIAEKYCVKINDALIASTMQSIGSEEIYSHDGDFDKVDFIHRIDPIPF
jgi:predicted nucleic acid-binding protein